MMIVIGGAEDLDNKLEIFLREVTLSASFNTMTDHKYT